MSERYERGFNKLNELEEGAAEHVVETFKDIAPDLGKYVIEFVFGDIFSRPGLDSKSRQLAVVAALTALGTASPQLKFHLNRALILGWSRTEMLEVIMQMAVYAGFPAALNALSVAKEVFAERDKEGKS